jgi:hypothetical protein
MGFSRQRISRWLRERFERSGWEVLSVVQRSKRDLRKGSEYGGVEGLVQPEPHTPTPSESLMMMYATDAAATLEQETEELPPITQQVSGWPS